MIVRSVTATQNSGGGNIMTNTVGGSLTAQNNTPAYTVSGNTVSGTCNNNGTHTC
ncbi:MAG: hypothetical protein JO050_05740 [Acidimicrobiia bacterium]|nr:hypothetical protein [Acidimicrobiia bacterium]